MSWLEEFLKKCRDFRKGKKLDVVSQLYTRHSDYQDMINLMERNRNILCNGPVDEDKIRLMEKYKNEIIKIRRRQYYLTDVIYPCIWNIN